MSKKLLSAGVLLSLVVTVLVGAGAITASAQDLCATVDALAVAGIISADKVAAAKAAAGCGVTAPVSASYTFTRDLTIGATGADVTALQNFLLSNGNTIPAGATGYFGTQTRDALAAYQAAKGITPAVGYFGPMTRASVNANTVVVAPTVPVVPTTPVVVTPVLAGGEGELNSFDTTTGTDSSVQEGQEEVKVLGIEFDAEDSDMMVNRVDVDVTVGNTAGASSQLDNYITEVSLMIGGEIVASQDVDEADEEDDIYSFRFTGLDSVVKEDTTAKMYVLVSAVNNIDGDDAGNDITVTIPVDGVRAVDASGLSDTYVSPALSDSFDVGEEDIADVTITESTDNPDASILVAEEDDESSEYTVFSFDIESEDAATEVNEIVIDVVSASSTVNNLIKDLILVIDGEEYEGDIVSTTATSTSYTFDIDGDIEIDTDDEISAEVKVVLNQQDGNYSTSGESLTFSLDGADQDIEDIASGDEIAITENVDGETHSIALVGINVTTTKSSTVTSVDGGNGDYVTHKFTLSVKSLEDTIYVPLTASTVGAAVGFDFDTMQTWTGATTINVVQTSDLDEVSSSVMIEKNQTATVEVSITFNPTSDGYYGVELNAVKFSETAGNVDLVFTAPDTSAFQTSNSFVTAD